MYTARICTYISHICVFPLKEQDSIAILDLTFVWLDWDAANRGNQADFLRKWRLQERVHSGRKPHAKGNAPAQSVRIQHGQEPAIEMVHLVRTNNENASQHLQLKIVFTL